MDNQGLTGIADTHSLCLRVLDDIYRHLAVRGFIHINVTVPCSGLDNRHSAVLHHIGNQPGAPSGNKHINKSVHFHHILDHRPAGILHQKD